MATTTFIEKLVVTLDLDSSKFTAGVAAAQGALKQFGAGLKQITSKIDLDTANTSYFLNKYMKSISKTSEETGEKVEKSMGRGTGSVLALIAAVYKLNEAFGLPALRRMTQEVVNSETATARLAASLRLDAVELQAWQKTVQLHGGDAEGFNSALTAMSANLGKLGTHVRGAKILQQYLGLAGITDDMAKAKEPLSFLLLFAQQMQGMSPERQLLVGKRLGLDQATIRTLQEGGPLLLQHLANMRELAATNQELQNAKEVAFAQAEANLQWERAKQVIAVSFLPMLTKLAGYLKSASQWIREHAQAVKTGVIIIASVLAGLAVVAAAAAAVIMLAGLNIAIGMTLATGGAWAVGAAAGVAALTAIAVAAGLTASAFDATKDAHAGMVDEIITGDQRLVNAEKAQHAIAQTWNTIAAGLKQATAQVGAAEADLKHGQREFTPSWMHKILPLYRPLSKREKAASRESLAQGSEAKEVWELAGKRFAEGIEAGAATAYARDPKGAAYVASKFNPDPAGLGGGGVHVDTITVNVGHGQTVNLQWDGKQIVGIGASSMTTQVGGSGQQP